VQSKDKRGKGLHLPDFKRKKKKEKGGGIPKIGPKIRKTGCMGLGTRVHKKLKNKPEETLCITISCEKKNRRRPRGGKKLLGRSVVNEEDVREEKYWKVEYKNLSSPRKRRGGGLRCAGRGGKVPE